ncbi:MAG: ATP-binding cassette domain-containing protein [Chlorobium sp.]|nr:ATP-binding cassette domain-containing protein [Chlorobium sp.]
MSLKSGKVYALMGGNGAGKTTLFNIVTGFIKPQSGKILFDGKNLAHQQPYAINRHGIGRTFQDLRLITKLSVLDNVILAMQHKPTDLWFKAIPPQRLYHKSTQQFTTQAEKIIAMYQLNDVKDSLAGEISYGQQKLLTLACCVANGSKMILLDEAVAGVQPEYRNKIGGLIHELKERGKTILLIEHNTEFIADVADCIYFLHEGVLSAYESMAALRDDKQVMAAYI